MAVKFQKKGFLSFGSLEGEHMLTNTRREGGMTGRI
jgi:hypothetical protein